MAISAGLALVSTTTAVLTGATLIGGGILAHFLATTALGAAINALSPKPSSSGQFGFRVTANGSSINQQIVYGRSKVWGTRVFDASSGGNNNTNLNRVIVFAAHEIDAFERIYINDSYVDVSDLDSDGNVSTIIDSEGNSDDRYDGRMKIKIHLGSDDQVADQDLIDEDVGWTSNHRLRGLAYLYIQFRYKNSVYPNGVPEISAVIRGKKVYNPRTEETVWTNNPSLCVRDFISNSVYGLGESSENIDDERFSSQELICKQRDFTLNGAFTTDLEPIDILQNMLSSMGGLLWYSQGKWRVKAATWTNPVETFDMDDFRSSLSVNTRNSRRDNFNTIKGLWRGEETNWQDTEYSEVTNQDFIDADNGEVLYSELNLPFTTNHDKAREIANIYLEKYRQQLTFSAKFSMKAFKVQVGDNVRINYERFGWVNKEFEVESWNFSLSDENNLEIDMTLRETAESVFDAISDGVVYERDNTNLDSPFYVPTPFLEIPTVEEVLQQDGTTLSLINFSWGVFDNEDRIANYNFEWKRSTDNSWNSTLLVGTNYSITTPTGTSYDYRVTAINTLGVESVTVSGINPVITGQDSTIPRNPTGLTITPGYGAISLGWNLPTTNTDNSAANDISHVLIYRGLSNNPTTIIGQASGTKFSDVGLDDSTTYFYRLKTVDYSGNESSFSSSISTTTLTAPQGLPGTDGASVLVVYADNVAGDNQSLTVGSRQFVQYVEYTGQAPTLPVSGDFVRFQGIDGDNGQSIWPIYATNASGSSQSFTRGSREFVTFFESTTQPTLPVTGETFVQFVGEDGAVGPQGPTGERGPGRWNIAVVTLPDTSTQANNSFVSALGFNPVEGDQGWFYTGTLANLTGQRVWIYNGANWVRQDEVIEGNLLVTGSITADKVDTNSFNNSGLSVFGGALESDPYQAGQTGWRIDNDGSAEFNGVVISKNLVFAEGSFTINPGQASGGTVYRYVNSGITMPVNAVWQAQNNSFIVAAAITSGASASGVSNLNNSFWGIEGHIIGGARWNGFNNGVQPSEIWQQDPAQLIPLPGTNGGSQRLLFNLYIRATSGISFPNPTISWKIFRVT